MDQVTLHSNIIHWFSKSGEVLAYRFFANEQSYTLHIPENVPQLLTRARDYFDKHGKAFNL